MNITKNRKITVNSLLSSLIKTKNVYILQFSADKTRPFMAVFIGSSSVVTSFSRTISGVSSGLVHK